MPYFLIAWKGFLKYRKRRKNLTIVLIGSFFLVFLFISLFSTIYYNIDEYWGKMLSGSGAVVLKKYSDYKVLSPPSVKDYFSYKDIKDSIGKIKGVSFSRRSEEHTSELQSH